MRRTARVDANQSAVVAALRRMGVFVQSLAELGGGVPDLLAITKDRVMLLEVKDGAKAPSERRLTPAQAKWHAACPCTVHVVTSPLQALEVVLGVRPR